MGRKKRTLGEWPASFERFEPFDEDEWDELEKALRQEIKEEMLCSLEDEMSLWLSAFRHASEFQYGAEERGTVEKVQAYAGKLALGLTQTGKAGEMALDDLCERRRLSRLDFMLCLTDITRLSDYFEKRLESRTRPDLSQVYSLVKVFDEFCVTTNISKATDHSFIPSPFAYFVDRLWKLRPELRVYTPHDDVGDYFAALSQWLIERRNEAREMRKAESDPSDG